MPRLFPPQGGAVAVLNVAKFPLAKPPAFRLFYCLHREYLAEIPKSFSMKLL